MESSVAKHKFSFDDTPGDSLVFTNIYEFNDEGNYISNQHIALQASGDDSKFFLRNCGLDVEFIRSWANKLDSLLNKAMHCKIQNQKGETKLLAEKLVVNPEANGGEQFLVNIEVHCNGDVDENSYPLENSLYTITSLELNSYANIATINLSGIEIKSSKLRDFANSMERFENSLREFDAV